MSSWSTLNRAAEQTVAHGAAGRAVSEISVVRRGPVNGDVQPTAGGRRGVNGNEGSRGDST